MGGRSNDRKLRRLGDERRRLQEERAVLVAQLDAFVDEGEYYDIQAMVTDDLTLRREADDQRRQREVHRKALDSIDLRLIEIDTAINVVLEQYPR